jgi:hypothetical protein
MPVLALSATATTGLFTLAGALVGAAIGGSITLALEILRRRWQRQDESGTSQRERLAAVSKERKDLYPKFLAKGIELRYTIDITRVSEKASKSLAKKAPFQDEAAFIYEVVSRIYELSGIPLREFDNLLAHVKIIAGPEVSRLAGDWDDYLSKAFSKATIYGERPEIEDPFDSLVKAMKEELGYSFVLHVQAEVRFDASNNRGSRPRGYRTWRHNRLPQWTC